MHVCHRVFAPQLRSVAEQMFLTMQVPQRIAEVVAEILVDSDLCGHDSHGIQLLPLTLMQIEQGQIRPAVKPVVIRESAAVLQVDVGHGLAFYAAKTTMDRLVEKAMESGICCGTLVNYGNTGRLGHFVEMAAHQGCIALITNARGGGGSVAPFGGREGVMGTNPIAAGVPTGEGSPFVMDFSTGMIANGKILQALTNSLTLPSGCVRDKNGKPTTSPTGFMDGGTMLPFGGHKGYGIGLLTCLLGALNGDFSTDDSTMRGMYMQVIQVDALMDCKQYQGFVRSFLNFVQASNPVSGFNEVLVPGQSASRIRNKRLEDGIELPDAVFQQLVEWGEKLGVEIPG